MKRRLALILGTAMLIVSVAAGVANADPSCTGSLADRPSSCFNAGPGQPGFHGPGS